MHTNEHISDLKQRAAKMKSVVSIQEFYSRLESLDWFFSVSDSRSEYERGAKALEKLELTASHNDEFMLLLHAYRAYVFSGEEWKTPRLEKPPKPKSEKLVEMMIPVMSHSGAYLIQERSETAKEIWDKTTKADGYFILREISGREQLLGVFTNYQDVNRAASIASNSTIGGYDDVLIENIKLFNSVDEYMFN